MQELCALGFGLHLPVVGVHPSLDGNRYLMKRVLSVHPLVDCTELFYRGKEETLYPPVCALSGRVSLTYLTYTVYGMSFAQVLRLAIIHGLAPGPGSMMAYPLWR